MNTIEHVFGCASSYPKQDLFGLELEIEDQQDIQENGLSCKGWQAVTDGSLRNFGMEYLTSPPVEVTQLEASLKHLFKKIKISENSYSDRTSIHVHCNMQGETIDTLKSFCLLYLVTEQVFFNFVARERFENVFCVPLMDFAAPFNLFTVLNKGKLARNWTKYSALNLLPLQELGTVEFRHMHGTNDVERIMTWVKAINCLKQAAKKKEFDDWRKQITGLNTTSEYGTFLVEIFGEIEQSFLGTFSFDAYHDMLYSNIMRAKLWEYAELQDKAKPAPKINNLLRYGDVELEQMLRSGLTQRPLRTRAEPITEGVQEQTIAAAPQFDADTPRRTRGRVIERPAAEGGGFMITDDILDENF